MRWGSALFPHVLLKNVIVEMQFSREDGLLPVDGYEPWASAFSQRNSEFGPSFEQNKCEVMMMVGLPASGKSTWAEKWVKEHQEKRYILLGTNLVLEQMKVGFLLVAIVLGSSLNPATFSFQYITNTLIIAGARIIA